MGQSAGVVGPTLWQVERESSKVFLFGETVGVRRDDVWLSEPILRAVDSCREFWCEVADAAEIAASPSLGKYGLATEPLSSRLDQDQLRVLACHRTRRRRRSHHARGTATLARGTTARERPPRSRGCRRDRRRARRASFHGAGLGQGDPHRTPGRGGDARLLREPRRRGRGRIPHVDTGSGRATGSRAPRRKSQRGWSATDPSPRPRSSRCRGSIPPSTGACWWSETEPGCHASSRCCARPAARSYSSAIRTCPASTGYRPCSLAAVSNRSALVLDVALCADPLLHRPSNGQSPWCTAASGDARPGAPHDLVGVAHRAGVVVELGFVLERTSSS